MNKSPFLAYFLSNSLIIPTIHDVKALWNDVKELINLFYCQQPDCKRKAIAMKNYDTVAKKIRCGCDGTKYDWKKV